MISWSIFWSIPAFSRRAVAIFACMLLVCMFLLTGCQGKTKQTRQQQADLSLGETDHACSYAAVLWGRHAELLLRFEEALEFYQKALICDDQAEFISEKIPILLLRLDRIDEAALWLQRYLSLHPEKALMRMLYAKVLMKQEKGTEAMHQYQRIGDRHADDPAIALLLAEMYLAAGQADKARPLLERVLSEDQTSYPALLLMARLHQAEGRVDEAVAGYRKVLARNGSPELQMELGELFITGERYDEAAALYKDLMQQDEQNEGALKGLIHVYLLQKKDDQALVALNRLKTYGVQPSWVDLAIARLHARQQRYDKAIALLETILAREHLDDARSLVAVLLVQQKQYGRALKHVRLVDKKAPEYLDALFLQVRILKEQKRLGQAKELLEAHIKSVELRHAEVYVMLAALHQLERRDDQGEKVLLQGLEVFPNDANLLYEYGLFLEEGGDHSAALDIMQKVIAIKPDNAAALNFVGFSWADKNINLDQALAYIQRAITLKPDNGYIRDSLGWVYFRLGKREMAIKELETAVQLFPEDASILEHLAEVYLENGQLKDAVRTYKKVLRFAPEDAQEKNRIKMKIQTLERRGLR